MTRLFRGLWNILTTVKNATGNIIFVSLIVLLLVAMYSNESPSVPDTTALILNPTGVIVDQKTPIDPWSEFLSGYEEDETETLLRDLLEAIDKGTKDDRVKSLVLDLSKFNGASMSKLEEVSSAILRFKEAGKPVFAFAPAYSQGQYLLAVNADKIYLDEQSFQSLGGVFLTGLGVYPTFFKEALDKLKVNVHIFKAGLYKGAVEPFLRNDMSDEAKEANTGWISVLWNQYKEIVVEARNITPESFDNYTNQFDEMLAAHDNDSSQLALQQGLVDGILTRKAWRKEMQSIVGVHESTYNHVSYKNYLAAVRDPIPTVNPGAAKIAVITASGTIFDGKQPAGNIGGDSLSKLVRQAREDDQVKAVVVRIDSPGGSASASELIRSELELTQDQGKPVVVSMSGYAASGGYWIASTANLILAAKTTVTGSIGVFSIFPTFDKSMSELGIYSDGVGTTSLSGAFNPLQAINPVIEKTLAQSVNHTYAKFLALVAKGREMSVEDVDKIAQGRIWAGSTAVELGLVDSIGNLADAIKSAAALVDEVEYEVVYLEKELSTRELLFKEIFNSSLQAIHTATGGVSNKWQLMNKIPDELDKVLEMTKAPGVYVQCLYCSAN
jgi:protease IV